MLMGNTAYEQLARRFELYSLLQEGLEDVAAGKVQPFSQVIDELQKDYDDAND